MIKTKLFWECVYQAWALMSWGIILSVPIAVCSEFISTNLVTNVLIGFTAFLIIITFSYGNFLYENEKKMNKLQSDVDYYKRLYDRYYAKILAAQKVVSFND